MDTRISCIIYPNFLGVSLPGVSMLRVSFYEYPLVGKLSMSFQSWIFFLGVCFLEVSLLGVSFYECPLVERPSLECFSRSFCSWSVLLGVSVLSLNVCAWNGVLNIVWMHLTGLSCGNISSREQTRCCLFLALLAKEELMGWCPSPKGNRAYGTSVIRKQYTFSSSPLKLLGRI